MILILHSIWPFYLILYLTFCLAFFLTLFLAGWSPARPTALRLSPVEARRGPQRSDSLSPVEVRRGPQRSRASSWGPAKPCHQVLAEEVRRRPLRSSAGRWCPAADDVRRRSLRSRAGRRGPARPTAIKSWQMRSGEAHCDREVVDEVRRGGEEGEAAQLTTFWRTDSDSASPTFSRKIDHLQLEPLFGADKDWGGAEWGGMLTFTALANTTWWGGAR